MNYGRYLIVILVLVSANMIFAMQEQQPIKIESLEAEFISKNTALRCLIRQVKHDKKEGITVRSNALEDFRKSFCYPSYTITNPFSQRILRNLGLLSPTANKVSNGTRTVFKQTERT